ncbi:hypothetical protein ET33_07060 [Paenibacillus tyrfis]|uniref:Uncharacterized protein n=2 Tax=Paenibacillus tyrfis TaxID=1501230 RepID=A0A081P2A0_9BACL|nr:hypothetical protein ET33_07060 [Paenibacillus tyrfis]
MGMDRMSLQLKNKPGIGFNRWPSWIGSGAIVWSALYGALHLYWLLGGPGYPFKDQPLGLFSAMVTYLPAQAGGAVFVVLCLLGIGVGLAMQRPWGTVVPRWLILGYAWGMAAALLLLVPDIGMIMFMAYAFLLKAQWSWQLSNQLLCMIGALLWIFAAMAYRRRARHACEYCGRTENGTSVPLVRWGRWMTWIAALAPLPYAMSRFAWALDIPLGIDPQDLQHFSKANEAAHVIEWVFGTVCIGGGLLTLGLIRKWGEVFPRWFPFIGGKRVPIRLAVIPATGVAIAVTAAGFVFTVSFFAATLRLMPVDQIVLRQLYGAVGPMLSWVPWGVALGLAAMTYYYRRRGRCNHCGKA